MLASQVIEMIKAAIEKHGDLPLVTGVDRTGYGETIVDIKLASDTINIENQPTPVLDLILNENSLVATGSW
jgi:hypothetical protein